MVNVVPRMDQQHSAFEIRWYTMQMTFISKLTHTVLGICLELQSSRIRRTGDQESETDSTTRQPTASVHCHLQRYRLFQGWMKLFNSIDSDLTYLPQRNLWSERISLSCFIGLINSRYIQTSKSSLTITNGGYRQLLKLRYSSEFSSY